MNIICSDVGQPLREELANSPDKIIEKAFPQFAVRVDGSMAHPGTSTPDEGLATSALTDNFENQRTNLGSNSDAYFHGLSLVSTLVKLMPEWLHNNRVVFDSLVLIWNSPGRTIRLQNEQELSLVQVKESKWLVKCFLNYLRHDKSEVGVLFDMLSIFLFRTRIDFDFLKRFYIFEVAEGYAPNMKITILLHFLNLFQLKQLAQDHLVEKLLDPPEEISAEYDEPLLGVTSPGSEYAAELWWKVGSRRRDRVPHLAWDRTCTAAAAIGLLSELHLRLELSSCGLDKPAEALDKALDILLDSLTKRRLCLGRSISRKERNYLF